MGLELPHHSPVVVYQTRSIAIDTGLYGANGCSHAVLLIPRFQPTVVEYQYTPDWWPPQI